MKGLIRRILGMERREGPITLPQDESYFRDEPSFEPEEPRTQKGEYSVPETLNPDGFYAVQTTQAEMYDPGNFAFISHFILYDRKEGIAVDVTSDVKPAQRGSATRSVKVLSHVNSIEKYLTGEVKPEFKAAFYQGVALGVYSFVARELSDACYVPLRARMVELRDAGAVLDTATHAFREQAINLKTKDLFSVQETFEYM